MSPELDTGYFGRVGGQAREGKLTPRTLRPSWYLWASINILSPLGLGHQDIKWTSGAKGRGSNWLIAEHKDYSSLDRQRPCQSSELWERLLSEARLPRSQQTQVNFSLTVLGNPTLYLDQSTYLLMRFSASRAKCCIWAYSSSERLSWDSWESRWGWEAAWISPCLHSHIFIEFSKSWK